MHPLGTSPLTHNSLKRPSSCGGVRAGCTSILTTPYYYSGLAYSGNSPIPMPFLESSSPNYVRVSRILRIKKNTERGITLVELLTGIAILAILMALAIPSNEWLKRARLSTFSNQLTTSLAFAKSEAMRLGIRVTVCRSAAPTAAAPACGGAGNWGAGWIIFADNTHIAGNAAGTIDGIDTVLKVGERLNEVTATTGDNYADWVAFLPSGLSRGGGGAGNDTFTLCLPNKSGIAVAVNAIGRIQSSSLTCP
jgi:type IV fimbrial biogenesis protein FimT